MMSQQKRKHDDALHQSKKVADKEQNTDDEVVERVVGMEAELAAARAQLSELQARCAALQSANDAAHLREHNTLVRPAIKAAIESWVKKHAFIAATDINVDVTRVEAPVIGREQFAGPVDCHRSLWSRLAFACDFSLYVKLKTQRFLQHAIAGFVQESNVRGHLVLTVAPAPATDRDELADLTVSFCPIEGAPGMSGTVSFSASYPFDVIAYEVFPPTVAPAAHLLNVLFFSHTARYYLLESVWALASFIVPGSDARQRANAVSLRMLFYERLKFIPSNQHHLFGIAGSELSLMDTIGNRSDCQGETAPAIPLGESDGARKPRVYSRRVHRTNSGSGDDDDDDK